VWDSYVVIVGVSAVQANPIKRANHLQARKVQEAYIVVLRRIPDVNIQVTLQRGKHNKNIFSYKAQP